jgi:hypothetical protein
MRKIAALNSLPWVELAVLPPGQSHYWLFDPLWDAYGWVFQATAFPEPWPLGENVAEPNRRVEVTELFIFQKSSCNQGCASQIDITVTNTGDIWAPYTLWAAGIPPRTNMKILVIHDRDGRIKSIAVPAVQLNLRAGLRPGREELVTEVDTPGIELDELRSGFHKIAETFRIDAEGARLVRRNQSDFE